VLLTLNQVISQITTLGAAHLQIQSTGVGDFAEWQALERAYPLLWVFHETTSIGDRELVYSIRLVCADRVITGEEGDDTAGMEQEVLSDTLLILLDFLAYFQQQHAQSYKVITSASIDPFTERFNDRVAGNSVLIQIRQPFTWDACQIPQTGATIPPSVDGLTLYDFCDPSVIARLTPSQVACLEAEYGITCVDATVTQNGNPFFTVPAGATYPLITRLDGTNNLGSFNAGTKTLDFTSAPCSPVTFQINAINKESLSSGSTFNLITKLDGAVNSGSYDAPTDTLSFTSAATPPPSVSIGVSDTTPTTGQTITLTATPTNLTPTSYIFFTYDGATIEFIIEQAGAVYNWTVNRIGTYDVYVLATDGTLEVYGTVGVVAASGYVLDLITPQPVWAASLRRLRSGYTGDAAIVRRSSDNAVLSIGFVGENMDTAALTAFVGVGNGFTATLYNQMSTGNNANQSTAGNQPTQVLSGTIQLLGGKPTLVFNGTSNQMSMASDVTFAHGFVVARKSSNTNVLQYLLGGTGQGLNFGGTLSPTFANISVVTSGGNLTSTVNNTNKHQVSFKMGVAGAGRLRVDGTTQATGTTSATMVISIIGTRPDVPSFYHIGDFSESILYTSVLSDANELIIENNQRTFYSI